MSTNKCNVFLGGSCNPTTWRKDTAIPAFDAAGVTFFNPQIENWYSEFQAIEDEAKANADTLLFVIDPQTSAIASMLEAFSAKAQGRDVALVILGDMPAGTQIKGVEIPESLLEDLNRGRAYTRNEAKKCGIPVFETVEAAIEALIERYGN